MKIAILIFLSSIIRLSNIVFSIYHQWHDFFILLNTSYAKAVRRDALFVCVF